MTEKFVSETLNRADAEFDRTLRPGRGLAQRRAAGFRQLVDHEPQPLRRGSDGAWGAGHLPLRRSEPRRERMLNA